MMRAFAAMAAEKGCTASQLALAWVLAKGRILFLSRGQKGGNIWTRMRRRWI
ncbi:hypothetical protein ACQ86N_29585 [Puia sp. P3]|uniref:hypothetical protein n=1 Tax=Puia sp. P3 TaxID=3423952 RepID=UPI003D677398